MLKNLPSVFIKLLMGLLISHNLLAQKETLARTPPMGWNSWNKFGGGISEKLILETADAMVNSGMKDAGYEYVVIDDLWQKGRVKNIINNDEISGRDSNKRLIHDAVKFPNGIKFIGDYIHSKGLKFGLYTAPGTATCGGAPGSLGFEDVDIQTFADWGVDFIKLDLCSFEGDEEAMFRKWRMLLDKVARPIVLSCNPNHQNTWLPEVANMWRTTVDISPIWSYPPKEFKIFPSITEIIDLHEKTPLPQGPSSWNDPDMLQVGNGKLTDDENKAHFAMWAIFGAPLMAGNDLRNMSSQTIETLTNNEVIAIDQDPSGIMGSKINEQTPGLQVWVKKLYKYSDYAVALLNRTAQEADIRVTKDMFGFKGPLYIRDLWKHKDVGLIENEFSTKVPAHGVAIFKIVANERPVSFSSNVKFPALVLGDKIEAETYYNFEAGNFDDVIKGFSGKGYLVGKNHDWAGFGVTWKVNVQEAGKYSVELRYSNPLQGKVNYTIKGIKAELEGTKKNEWKTISREVTLDKGLNSIEVWSGSPKTNNVAIDYIKIIKNN